MKRISGLPFPFHPLSHISPSILVFHSLPPVSIESMVQDRKPVKTNFLLSLHLSPLCHLLTSLSQGSSEPLLGPNQTHYFCFCISSGKSGGCLVDPPHRLSFHTWIKPKFALVPENLKLVWTKDSKANCTINNSLFRLGVGGGGGGDAFHKPGDFRAKLRGIFR